MNTYLWAAYFRRNLRQFTPPPMPVKGTVLPEASRLPIVNSLAVFQLGESGGGTRLMRYVRQVVSEKDLAGYEEAVRLFIEEEHYHASLLKDVVLYLGGEIQEKQWSNSIFRWVRNLFGVEFNIQILLIAELVAEVYYGLLYRKGGDPVLKKCCHKILSDEMRHIAFHTEFFAGTAGTDVGCGAHAMAQPILAVSSHHRHSSGVGSSTLFPCSWCRPRRNYADDLQNGASLFVPS